MLVRRSILAKMLRKLPSEIDAEDAFDVDVLEFVTENMGEKNPLWFI